MIFTANSEQDICLVYLFNLLSTFTFPVMCMKYFYYQINDCAKSCFEYISL